jgi:hypothetical protein
MLTNFIAGREQICLFCLFVLQQIAEWSSVSCFPYQLNVTE